MSFDSVAGNDTIKKYLTKLINQQTIPQSLLFCGPQGSGKTPMAEAFAQLVVKTNKASHPDIHHYYPEGKIGMHSIQSLREFTEAVYMAPFESEKKVFILHDAHRMLSYSANALLKTFEEPSLNCIIILITHAPERLLPTVMSRCQAIRFQPTSKHQSLGPQKHPCRTLLLNHLSDGVLRSYSKLTNFVQAVSTLIENQLNEKQETLQTNHSNIFKEKPTAQQKQQFEKELEGSLSLTKISETKYLFDVLFSWFRDLHLLEASGDPSYLINSDYQSQLQQSKDILPLEKVENAIADATLSLERSTSINLCVENLLLKLSSQVANK